MGELPPADALPAPLVTRDQWVAWETKDRDGKQTKVPVDPRTAKYASATDADTWVDFATAREYATRNDAGIGFVFTDADPIVGVDLDDCRDPDDGTLTDWAQDIVERLDSFTEVSPSGTGVHVLVEGELPDGRNRHGDVELYDDARFFTVTGNRLSETPGALEPRQEALAAVHAEYVMPDDAGDGVSTDADSEGTADAMDASGPASDGAANGPGNDLGDEELLSRARSATNGEKFERLCAGDTSGYPSQSEADMALCSLLAFWTGGDPEQMDRLFRASGLVRPKWDEPHFADGATYGERTIERAIAGTDEFYTGSGGAGGSVSGRTDPVDGAADSSPVEAESEAATVSVDVVEELEAELQRLQSEKAALEAELEAEREARQALESEVETLREDGSEGGWLQRLGWW
jgi:putative DNA primase/helicase